MKTFYQIINFQFQSVRVTEILDAAKAYIVELQKTYTDEGFYVVEMPIIYVAPGTPHRS